LKDGCTFISTLETTSSVFPVFLLLIVVSGFAFLQPPSLVFLGDLVSGEDPCADKSRLEFSCREVIWRPSESFKPNDAVRTYAIDESESAWKNLDAQFRNEKRAIVDIDFHDASFIMRGRKRLSKVRPDHILQEHVNPHLEMRIHDAAAVEVVLEKMNNT
jgi:hypothetical protein